MSDSVLDLFLTAAIVVGVGSFIGALVSVPVTRIRNQRACDRGDHAWMYGRIDGVPEPEVLCGRCRTQAPAGVRPRGHLAEYRDRQL